MKFVLDQDVDARVGAFLISRGHDAWTASDAGLFDASDDDLTIYAASKEATLVTHDREFSSRRRRNPHGRHVELGCREPDAVEVLTECLDQVVEALTPFTDVFAYVSREGVAIHLRWT